MTIENLLSRGRKLIFTSRTCDIKRSSGDPSDYATPAEIHSDLSCSAVYEVSDEERERAGMTSISRPVRVYVDIPSSGVIQQHDKLVINSKEYLVCKAKLWPSDDPSFYELIMDYQR